MHQSRYQDMKSAIFLGSDEYLVSNILQEVGGDKNIASNHLYGSTKLGVHETESFSIKAAAWPKKKELQALEQ